MAKDLFQQLCCRQGDVGHRQVTELQGKGGNGRDGALGSSRGK